MTTDFGATLRRLRLARNLSLGRLAASVHYSTGHMSRVEHGQKRPSETLARLCDGALDAGGELVRHPAVAGPAEPESHPRTPPNGHGSWATSGGSLPAAAPMDEQWALFDAVRGLGRAGRPAAVLPIASGFFDSVRSAISSSMGEARRQQMVLAARVAEYLGWMWQESGDDVAALAWTDRAVDIARAADDVDLGEYAAARRALVMLYRRKPADVVALAERVSGKASGRVRWLAALRLALGHALAGDHPRCMNALERARWLTDDVDGSGQRGVLGPAGSGDRVAAVTGWCLYDLGRPAEAIPALRSAVATMARHTREYPRFGVRLALSRVAAGDLPGGCATMEDLLDVVVRVDSATIRTDLRRFGHLIERHHRDPVAGALRQRLSTALHPDR